MPSWESDNIFAGTAWYYARYRPEYPEQVIHLVKDKFNLNKNSRVLDMGCGTGLIALQLAPLVSEVVAMDPLDEMLNEGRLLATRKGISNITWLLGESGNIARMALDIGEIDLTVIAQAFHWMDREQTLHDLYPLLKSGGGVAVIATDGPKTDYPDTDWKVIISDTVRSWMGDVRKAGTKGTYIHPTKRFETVLAESQFHGLESYEFKTKRTWTMDSIMGYLYSTSSTSIPVLGDKKEAFEADLRTRLAALEPSGLFKEDAITEVIVIWK
jgi:ubiquinone/menaquinone biosynthesis C-methylase UbiE